MEGWNDSPFTSSIVTVTPPAVASPKVVPITSYSPVARSIRPSEFWSAPNSSPSARRARDSIEFADGLPGLIELAHDLRVGGPGRSRPRLRMKISSSLSSLLM